MSEGAAVFTGGDRLSHTGLSEIELFVKDSGTDLSFRESHLYEVGKGTAVFPRFNKLRDFWILFQIEGFIKQRSTNETLGQADF